MAKKSHQKRISSKNVQNLRPKSLKYYLIPEHYHRIIGSLATKAHFAGIKDFIGKKIPLVKTKSEKKHMDYVEEREPKQQEKSKPATKEEIKKLTQRSNEVLATAKTVFPFTLFPDDVVLDRTKITITKRDFFMTNRVISIRIEDVLNVSADFGPFFGSITVASRVLSSEDHFRIDYFWRKDAIHLKHMIQGYVIALHNKIECSHLNKDELIETLAELGHDLNK